MSIDLPYDLRSLVISSKDFWHPSFIHGMGHTLRVSIFASMVGNLTGHVREGQKASVAALFHDMARNSDGKDAFHGKRSAEQVLPKYKEYILSLGFSENDIQEMQCAIEWHSSPKELPSSHPYCLTTYLLKDADALDRIRIKALDPQYLRLADGGMIEMAKTFYIRMLGYIPTIHPEVGMLSPACEDIIQWIGSEDFYYLLQQHLDTYPESSIRCIMDTLDSPMFYYHMLNL